MSTESTKPVIFISYSHKDEPDRFLQPGETQWLSYIRSFLDPAAASGFIELWDDRRIDGGGAWRAEISEALERCAVCVFLVSRHSLSSRFILDVEMKRMLERHYARGAHLFPIVITSTDLGVAPWLLKLNLKPTNGTALELYETGPRNKVMADLAAEIRIIVERTAEGMIERLRGDVLRVPDIPIQGYGPHFEIGDDGAVHFAPPDTLDRQGNNVGRLKSLHPSLRKLSSDLVKTLGGGNIPHWHLRDRAEAYRALVDQDLERIDFSQLYVEGVHLANADKAALGEKELPPLTPPVRAAIDTLLQVHGAFIMATAEGLEIIAAEERYRRTPQEETEFRMAAVGFANNLINRPQVIDPKVATFVLDAVQEIGRGNNTERSGTIAAGTLKNVVITVTTAATLASLTVAAAASQTPALIVGAGTIVLVVGDGLRKSKPFSTLAALVTKGFDKASETELAKAYKEVSERLKPQLKFVLEAEQWLRRLADQRESGLKWVSNSLDWVKKSKKIRPMSGGGSTRPGIHDAPEMIVVPAGDFMMGSPEGEGDYDERPQHKVTIKNAFAISISPVTRGEFAAFVDATNHRIDSGAYVWIGQEWKDDPKVSWRDPGFWQDDDHPVVCVNWHDAQAYAVWLRERSGGKAYRLLSEAEWEYCCRAGTASAYSTGDTITAEQANFGENSTGTTSVFRFPPNPWGLHDMHGNVLEWCEDNWHPNYESAPEDESAWKGGNPSSRVVRGGCWGNDPRTLRSAKRNRDRPDFRNLGVGFRVARTL